MQITPQLYIIDTPLDMNDNDFERILNFIPQDRIDRIRKFHFRRSALQSLCGELITRLKISELLNIPIDSIDIVRNTFGKPHCTNSDRLFFNVAHSGHLVAAAFDTTVIGVDIECMRNTDLAIADRFFSKNEAAAVKCQPDNLQRDYFFRLWTLKESFIKAEGKGLAIPLDSFEFTINCDNSISFSNLSKDQCRHYFFRHYDTEPDYKCALCCESGVFPNTITKLGFEDLCEAFARQIKP